MTFLTSKLRLHYEYYLMKSPKVTTIQQLRQTGVISLPFTIGGFTFE